MTNEQFDTLLNQALTEAILEELHPALCQADTLSPNWSSAYLHRRTKILADPFGYAKRKTRPVWQKALRLAACFLLVCSISAAGIFTLSPEARAWGLGVLRQWFPQYTNYIFGVAPEPTPCVWLPQYLPEGYALTITFDPTPNATTLTYEDEFGHYIDFTYQTAEAGAGFAIDNEHSVLTPAYVNESPADLYTSNQAGWPHHLVWSASNESVSFHISADDLSPSELIKIAETVENIKK